MKLTVSQLRRIIKEEAAKTAAGALPTPEEDVYVYPDTPEYGGEEIGFQYITDAGDLQDFPDDLGWDPGAGPEPGTPGTWLATDDGMTWTFKPGDLVLAPEYDQGVSRAWTRKSNLPKLAALSDAGTGSPEDQKVLKLLGKVTTYGAMPLNAVKAFDIRLRTDNILFNYDPYGKGITGTITRQDLKTSKVKMTLPELAQWMLDHGAQKIKPQKRTRYLPDYD